MPDTTNDLPDDDLDPSDDGANDGAGDDGDDAGQQGVTAEQLQARVAELETLNTRQSRDLIAAIGRLQALDEKLTKGSGDDSAVAALKAGLDTANEMLDALLEDEAIDPKVKERATRARTTAQARADREEAERLRQRVEELEKNPPRPAAAPSAADNAPTPLEEGLVAAIEAAGLDPDDENLFDWKGEATRLLRTQDARAVTAYFRKQIAAGLEAKNAANRREVRRGAGLNQNGRGGDGGATGPLDPSRSAEERYQHLKSIGAV